MAIGRELMKATAVAESETESVTSRMRDLVRRSTGEHLVWGLTATVSLTAALIAWGLRSMEAIEPARAMPLWLLAGLFYLGEITVVHVKFKRNTQSFSMSEVPLVLALLFSPPLALLVAQLLGNTVALAANRRQHPLKLFFNLAQFSLVSALTVRLFRALTATADPFGPLGWVSVVGAVAIGSVAANALVHLAIRASGARLTLSQIREVLIFSTCGAAMNASLGMLGVVLLQLRPSATSLALLPVVVIYAGYRSHVAQRGDRHRLEALYEVTRVLHASPQIDRAIEAAAVQVQRMFESERVDVLLAEQLGAETMFQTTVDSGEVVRAMTPIAVAADHDVYEWLESMEGPAALHELPPVPNTSLQSDQIIAAPLRIDSGTIGVIVAAEPLSDVGGFTSSDVKLLGAVAGKISVSLQNGRLEDSLVELTLLKERLEAQVKSKDQFIATVSHELRTPLTTVLGLSHELGERRDAFSEEELDEIISLIASESTELSNLIEDLLVGARADVSTLPLHPQFTDIAAELDAVIGGHAYQTADDDRIRVVFRSQREKLWADPLRMRQIVRNLLTNAARYGGDCVWVEVDDRDDQVVIAVVDDGEGVPERMTGRIFEAYERGHEFVRRQPGSVGLGLAVSRRLADLMGGSLGYRRISGYTYFELCLPAVP